MHSKKLITEKLPRLPVGILAASSIVAPVEFERGLNRLRETGFDPIVHEQVLKHHFTFAGSDEERAGAFYAYAKDPRFFVLWMARGGYGAQRLLPLLDQLTEQQGIPRKKLLVGYSDVTVLHEYVRTRWGWSTLHAPMPSASNFRELADDEYAAITSYIRSKPAAPPWANATLSWLTPPPPTTLQAELIGGNLSLWASLAGTPYAQPGAGKIIFLEDIDEAYYRIDRMMIQLEQTGAFDGAAAIILGDFTNCKDENNTRLASEGSEERVPLRKTFERDEAFDHIFAQLGNRLGVPIAQGLPVGHGPHYAPLPLGAQYQLTPGGQLQLLQWDWLRNH
ncbi:MAG TPA: LD-carboxypeptidase [Tepidisphaeraceae bacterium]|jgi:muramoyltetrapeptide carboxypeptidase